MDTLQIDFRGVDALCAIAESNGLEPGAVFENYMNKVAKPLVHGSTLRRRATPPDKAALVKPAPKVRAS